MDFKTALEILEVSEPYTKKILKKQYFKKALIYHPDKNDDPDSNTKFHKIQEAYTYLSDNIDMPNTDTAINDNFFVIIEQLFNIMKSSTETNINDIINVILENCHLITLSTFEKIDKHKALKIFGYIEKYATILCIDDDMVAMFREIIQAKLQDDELIILNPSIDNLLNSELYILEHKTNTYYIPLWHEEVTYETNGHLLIVKCIPQLPEHVYIDENNNIHINIKLSVVRAFNDKKLSIALGKKVFNIDSSELKLSKNQVYVLHQQGIPIISTHDNYNTQKKGNITIHINLY
tara:strand:+ start:18 stop:893 length:876 start_codon:yes stop_codon:yes gene_type:complete